MSAIENVVTFEELQRSKWLEKRAEFRELIKSLAAEQSAEKKLLRMPHGSIPEQEYPAYGGGKMTLKGTARASRLMYSCWSRARSISGLLVDYKKFLGKPYDMHESKKK